MAGLPGCRALWQYTPCWPTSTRASVSRSSVTARRPRSSPIWNSCCWRASLRSSKTDMLYSTRFMVLVFPEMSWAQNTLRRVRKLGRIARKLRLIAVSDLVPGDKLRYVLHAAGGGKGVRTYRLQGGVNRLGTSIALRQGATDSKVFDEIFVEQVYAPCVASLPHDLGRVALIDLGANIGLSVLFLTRALEVAEIIAVEPEPDNFRLLSENLRRTGLAQRSTAVCAFAGAERAFAELQDSGN